MTDRPIIFSAPMVRALLDGRKTQTRRIAKLPTKGIYERPDMGGWAPTINGGAGTFRLGRSGERIPVPETIGIWHRTCGVVLDAPWQPGDRLWVREAFSIMPRTSYFLPKTVGPDPDMAAYYRADFDRSGRPQWKPSIHMPRWASRLTLTVTDVHAQRLQDISHDDARAEGAERLSMDDDGKFYQHPDGTFYTGFAGLWSHINGPDAWDANPWVWALTFTVHKGNIDTLPTATL